MMDNELLKRYWQENEGILQTYVAPQIDQTKINEQTFQFLTTFGLPIGTEPFLSFDFKAKKLLTPGQFFDMDLQDLDHYVTFGTNSSGDPLCIDTSRNDQIVYLNHDTNFERTFINSSILQFGVCLMIYHTFMDSLTDKDLETYNTRKFSDQEFEELKDRLLDKDSSCLAEDAFWKEEVDYLLWIRDND